LSDERSLAHVLLYLGVAGAAVHLAAPNEAAVAAVDLELFESVVAAPAAEQLAAVVAARRRAPVACALLRAQHAARRVRHAVVRRLVQVHQIHLGTARSVCLVCSS